MTEVFSKNESSQSGGIGVDRLLETYERINSMKFEAVEKKIDEVKQVVLETDKRMERGFERTEQRFWALALSLIGILLSICAFLIAHALFMK